MKWSDIKKVKRYPKDGSLREKTSFLFLPKKIGHETRWLEVATWVEEFKATEHKYSIELDWEGIVPKNKWEAVQWK